MNKLFERRITGCEPHHIRSLINDMMDRIRGWNRLLEDEEYEFRLILNELIANGTVHGNKGICTKGITATLQATDGDTLCITVQDEGTGFNYRDVGRDGIFSCDLSPLSERGRGLKLIKAICDDIQFNQAGNIIRIKKSIRQNSVV